MDSSKSSAIARLLKFSFLFTPLSCVHKYRNQNATSSTLCTTNLHPHHSINGPTTHTTDPLILATSTNPTSSIPHIKHHNPPPLPLPRSRRLRRIPDNNLLHHPATPPRLENNPQLHLQHDQTHQARRPTERDLLIDLGRNAIYKIQLCLRASA